MYPTFARDESPARNGWGHIRTGPRGIPEDERRTPDFD